MKTITVEIFDMISISYILIKTENHVCRNLLCTFFVLQIQALVGPHQCKIQTRYSCIAKESQTLL